MKALVVYGNRVLARTNLALHPLQQGDWVNLKTWKTSGLQDQLTPKWSGLHLVILTTHSARSCRGSLRGCFTLE